MIGKYKLMGTVPINYVAIDGISLEQELLDNELAYRYDGGKKLSWCE